MKTESLFTQQMMLLARQEQITDSQFLELLASRIKTITEHMRDMSLDTIGDLGFTDTAPCKEFNPEVRATEDQEGKLKFNLDTRGIFTSQVSRICTSYKSHYHRNRKISPIASWITHKVWGYTRNGEFIKVKVLIVNALRYKKPRLFKYVPTIRRITINEDTLENVMRFANVSPQLIWDTFSKAVASWTEHREWLLKRAKKVHFEFEAIETLLKLNKKIK